MSLSCMKDFSDVFGGGYNSGVDGTNMSINMKGCRASNNHEHSFLIEKHSSHPFCRFLLNASSREYICTMRKKNISWHDRWRVYNGEYKGDKSAKPCFRVKRTSETKTKESFELGVFLDKKTEEHVCQLTIRNDICEISAGARSLAKAKMEKSVMNVEIEANVDAAFIVSLLVMVHEMKHNKFEKAVKGIAKAAKATVKAGGTIAMLAGINCPGTS